MCLCNLHPPHTKHTTLWFYFCCYLINDISLSFESHHLTACLSMDCICGVVAGKRRLESCKMPLQNPDLVCYQSFISQQFLIQRKLLSSILKNLSSHMNVLAMRQELQPQPQLLNQYSLLTLSIKRWQAPNGPSEVYVVRCDLFN